MQKLLDNCRGATMVESAIALPFFLLTIITTIELLRFSYVALTSQFVTTRIMREATIEKVDAGEIRQALARNLEQYHVALGDQDIVTYCPIDSYLTDVCPEGTIIAGGERSLMVLSVIKPTAGIVMPGLSTRSFNLRAHSVGRNEPV
jgi:hypothetical protein